MKQIASLLALALVLALACDTQAGHFHRQAVVVQQVRVQKVVQVQQIVQQQAVVVQRQRVVVQRVYAPAVQAVVVDYPPPVQLQLNTQPACNYYQSPTGQLNLVLPR